MPRDMVAAIDESDQAVLADVTIDGVRYTAEPGAPLGGGGYEVLIWKHGGTSCGASYVPSRSPLWRRVASEMIFALGGFR